MSWLKSWQTRLPAILLASFVFGHSEALCAEEAIKMESVQNELLKKSLAKTKAQGSTTGPETVTESDLDKVERRLEAAEQRLLERASSGPAAMPKPAFSGVDAPPAPALEGSQIEAKIQEKNVPATTQKASLDTQKLQSEVISGPVEPANRPAAIKIDGLPKPAAPVANEQLIQRNAQVEKELKDANERANALAKELDETRNRLMIAETQVERLSVIIESRGLSKSSGTGSQSIARSAPQRRNVEDENLPDDTQVATVIADKVHLRAGPSKENSPLMAVTKGTRLTVEMRNGDWYRVVAPTGRRAWISADVIAFGLNPKANFGQTSRIKGFDTDLTNGTSGE